MPVMGRDPTRARRGRVAVVVATRNRRDGLLATLDRLKALSERPAVVVVDNGSTDGTPGAVRAGHPDVKVIPLSRNAGAAARSVGVLEVEEPYVAFSDDDSWWAPGSLSRAADLLDAHPGLAVVAARVLVGRTESMDPTCIAMGSSPLRHRAGPGPGPAVLGFVACGAVVRRSAFLAVGGFDERFGVGGEEELLALDLAAAGWDLAYVPDIVAHHHPAPSRDVPDRRRNEVRNALCCAWLRRPFLSAMRRTTVLLRGWHRDPARRRGLADAARRLPWVLRERRVIPRPVEQSLRRLEEVTSQRIAVRGDQGATQHTGCG
jgi:GT2 family glycosyltransferase